MAKKRLLQKDLYQTEEEVPFAWESPSENGTLNEEPQLELIEEAKTLPEGLADLIRPNIPEAKAEESSVAGPKMMPVTAAEELSHNTFIASLQAEVQRAFQAEAHAHQNFSATNCLIKTIEEQIRPLQNQLIALKNQANWEYGRIQQAHLLWESARARLEEHCPTES